MLRKSLCEKFIKRYSTAIRIAIALDLIRRYNLSQLQSAKLTEVPQPLINYVLQGRRRIRGLEEILGNPEVYNMLKEVSDRIMGGEKIDLCEICMRMRSTLNIEKEP
uniref:Uncharacterized protein n=1 Tax=Fervidicoccus fontis TaxID=683846 RepID=A0A7J3ZLG1_9CREN